MDAASPPALRRWWRPFAWMALAALAVAAIRIDELGARPEDAGKGYGLEYLVMAAIYGIAAATASKVVARKAGWEKSTWRWFAVGNWVAATESLAIWAVATWAPGYLIEIGPRVLPPVGVFPFYLVGFLHASRRWRDPRLATRVLDILVVAVGTFFLLWSAVFRDVYAGVALPEDERIEVMMYPIVAAGLLTAAAVALGRDGRRHPAYAWVALATAIPMASELAGAMLTFQGNQVGILIGDAVMASAGVAWIVAARAMATAPPWQAPEGQPQTAYEQSIPLAVIGICLGSAVVSQLEHGGLSPLQFWLAVLAISLLLLRQAMTLSLNRRLEASIRDALEQRTRMLRFVSHELASPLTPLKLQVAALEHGTMTPDRQAKAFQIVRRSTKRFERLSDDLRTVVLAETGRLKLQVSEQDLATIAGAAADAARPQADIKHITITLDAAAATCHVDGERAAQAIDNLLSNAVKYTQEGGHVKVRVRPESGGARIEVEDDGLGMEPSQVERMFRPFTRFHEATAAGLGLGLHLCKGIMEAHGGRIGASSAGPKMGSTFWLSFPASPPAANVAKPLPPAAPPSGPTTTL